MSVIIFGSANLDRTYRVPTLPAPGETVLAAGSEIHLGGKGNNQATAAARAGATTTFVGALGDDQAAELIMEGFAAAGVEPWVRRVDGPSGTALIFVDDEGENSIVVDSGSNATIDRPTAEEAAAIADADLLLMQLELPVRAVTEAAEQAAAAGTMVVLNAAPMIDLPERLIAAVDLLVVNQAEASRLVGQDADREALLERVPAAVLTLGADGVWVGVRDQGSRTIPAHRVPVVDTTGAGDAFCGALTAELVRLRDEDDLPGHDHQLGLDHLEQAARFGNAAAALSVQRSGAVPSIPVRSEVEELLRRS